MAGENTAMAAAADSVLLREYELSDDDFQRIRGLVRSRLGIALAESKRELVYGRLSRRLRALKLQSFTRYLQRIESGDEEGLQHFCNAIPTPLTSFFRERHHFEYLAQRLLPALERSNGNSRRMRFWSAGCSTGEEPYSIAMVLLENMRHLRDWDIRILATDIDTSVLSHARAGLYSAERVQKVEQSRVQRWFEPAQDARQFQVREELKRLVCFK